MDFQWQYNPLAIPLGASLLLTLALIVMGHRQRKNPLAQPFLYFMACVLVWVGASLLEIVTLNLELSLFAADLSFLGITLFPLAWLGFVMTYSGQGQQYRRLLPWIAVVPLLTNLVIWTNPLHHLWRGESYRDLTLSWFPVSFYEYGPWFYAVHIPFGLVFAFLPTYLLLRSPMFREKAYRSQILIVLVAFNLPLAVELLHQVGLDPVPYFNASVLAFPISGLLIGWALLGFRFLDLTPIARDLVVENMEELMIVLDGQGRVVDANPAARWRFFSKGVAIVGENIHTLLPELAELATRSPENSRTLEEIEIQRQGETWVFEALSSPLNQPPGDVGGRLLLLRDITVRKRSEQAYYEQLQQIAVLEERQRLARELHDSVNQSLYAAGTLADLLPKAIAKRPAKVPEYASSIQQLIQGAAAQMRLVLLELYPDALTQTDLAAVIKHLCDAYTGDTGTPVDFRTSGPIHLGADAQIAFYRIAQEALHNISKHTDAARVNIRLTHQNGAVELVIQDDGQGFDPANPPPGHFGLQNMAHRAGAVGAAFNIHSQPNRGTTVSVCWRQS